MSDDGAFEDMRREPGRFETALRAAVLEAPDPAVEQATVRRLALTAKTAGERSAARPAPQPAPAPERRLPRFAMPVKVALVAGLLIVSTAGLAVAGVRVPSPVRNAFSTVGIDLPNQDEGNGATIKIQKSEPSAPSAPAAAAPAVAPPKKAKNPTHGKHGKPGHSKKSKPGHHRKPSKAKKPHPSHPSHPTHPSNGSSGSKGSGGSSFGNSGNSGSSGSSSEGGGGKPPEAPPAKAHGGGNGKK